jgi:hypothetical protein
MFSDGSSGPVQSESRLAEAALCFEGRQNPGGEVNDLREDTEEIPQELVLAFAPIHKRAFGMAVGLTMGLVVFAMTVVAILRPGYPFFVPLLSKYFFGYSVSWGGALVGFAWGWFAFFVAGWFTAFLRNLIIAVNIWIGYARAELQETRDFLDHV